VCHGDMPRVKLVDAKIVRVEGGPCSHKTFMYQLVGYPPFDWVQEQSTFQACWRNELVALQRRHLLNEGEPEMVEWKRCNRILAQLARLLGPVRVATPEEVVAHKGSPAARKRYAEAFASLDQFGPRPTWDRISAFVKVEKWPLESTEGDRKPPRLIQFRSYTYCAKLSQYLLPIEEQLWKLEVRGLRPFAKNMNSFEIASTLRAMADRFVDPVFVLLDHSKFDSCVTTPWICSELLFNTRVAGNACGCAQCGDLFRYGDSIQVLEELFDAQLFNRGYTKGGIRYVCKARKMSGEYNTSCGDTEINYSIVTDTFRDVNHHVLLNGDDGVVVLECEDLFKVDLSADNWRKYGFKTKVGITSKFSEIDFCQCRPVEIRPGLWRMVREPMRAISRSCVSVKRYEGRAWYGLVAAMGYSELACGDGVPMMQAWAQYLMRASCGVPPIQSELSRRARLERAVAGPKPVTDTARESFAQAFGISIDDQLDFETWCGSRRAQVLPACYPDDRTVV